MDRVEREKGLRHRQPDEFAVPGDREEEEVEQDQHDDPEHDARHHRDIGAPFLEEGPVAVDLERKIGRIFRQEVDQQQFLLTGIEDEFGAERLIGLQIVTGGIGVRPVDEQVEFAVRDLVEPEIGERPAPGGEDPAALLVAGIADAHHDHGLAPRRAEMDRRAGDALQRARRAGRRVPSRAVRLRRCDSADRMPAAARRVRHEVRRWEYRRRRHSTAKRPPAGRPAGRTRIVWAGKAATSRRICRAHARESQFSLGKEDRGPQAGKSSRRRTAPTPPPPRPGPHGVSLCGRDKDCLTKAGAEHHPKKHWVDAWPGRKLASGTGPGGVIARPMTG